MIISRSPLRLTLAGGGTDLESYFLGRGGLWISAAINKYCYSMLNPRFENKFLIKYAKIEEVSNFDEIKHNLIRETLRYFKVKSNLELTFTADIPGSTGLGSSASFLVSLITCLNSYLHLKLDKIKIAEISTEIEKEILNEPIGLQDQYIASLGGIKKFEVSHEGNLQFYDLEIENNKLKKLQNSLILLYTGIKRDSRTILDEQVINSYSENSKVVQRLDLVKSHVPLIHNALVESNINLLGSLFHEHWMLKSKQSKNMTNFYIDNLYEKVLANGALGGKLVGAGGGGFLLIVVNDRDKFIYNSRNDKYKIIDFEFESSGTTMVIN